ncbi:D-alanyl-D-alanine carboxypeptidase (penicillin-binding protein 5/6) [Hypnocyclicus thermotrophus]|uniref:serine-type D-Ala-D-Ala carboxypeptidase n=1 Tax=Hypnocyclicus thermotrophus TaxID=1627895 RepID=A0AA46DYY9_9FUSO|nr:D-alanyl-D-alanine carboxypeptidase family protein [Hypnocyclicus thermotrophus]TDT70500.1 D-alanyl-D-alanine carboxypeptidase (penicillin-binding protein 5/6) [Hypnocyclicus thermotrophus]
MKKIIFYIFLILNFIANADYVSKLTMDTNGNIIDSKNIYLKHPTASIAKIMTSVIVIDEIRAGNIKMDDKIKISLDAAKIGGSRISLNIGEIVTVKDLLKATLIHSANNAAYALAEYTYKDVDKFVEKMNEKAKELGLKDTKYYTPTGLPSDMTGKGMDISTAYDISKLSLEIFKNYKEIMDIVKLKTAKIKNNRYTIKTRNNFLKKNLGVIGLKTGHHDSAGYNMSVIVDRKNFDIIIVLLGAPNEKNRDEEIEKEINYVYNNYEIKTLVKKDDFIIQAKVIGGKKNTINLYAEKDYSALIKKEWKLEKTVYLPENIYAPIEKNKELGTYVIRYNNKELARIKLVNKEKMLKGNLVDEIVKKF